MRRLVVAWLTLLAMASTGLAQTEPAEVVRLRSQIESASAELTSVESEIADTQREASSIQRELEELDRDANLGPVQRRRYSQLKQESTQLAEKLRFLSALEGRVRESRRAAARQLIRRLEPEIARLKEAYQGAPIDSERRVAYFRDYERLIAERNRLTGVLFTPIPYLVLDVDITETDTPRSLREKADVLADNRDIIARLLARLSAWKREIVEDREILAEARRLEEENRFFMRVDPLEPAPVPGTTMTVELPDALRDFADRLALPPSGEWRAEQFDPLVEQIEKLEQELEDTILSMDERQKLVMAEARRREGLR